jgi:hypothetical protein
MPHRGDALLGAFAAAGVNRIGSHIDVRSDGVFVGEPTEVTRRKRMFQGSNALKNSVGILASKEQCDGLAWSEATGEEIGANIGRVLCPML